MLEKETDIFPSIGRKRNNLNMLTLASTQAEFDQSAEKLEQELPPPATVLYQPFLWRKREENPGSQQQK